MGIFARTIGIDYSGARTPTASLEGLRVYLAEGDSPPDEVFPPPSPRKYWTRKGVAHWLIERLAEDAPTLVGIDHGFSFPLHYFEVHGLEPDWSSFLDDFQRHWPTDEDHTYVDFVRAGSAGNGAARTGNARWRRLTEERAGGAKSVFHFDVPGQVAKSTHSGIPWLRFIRRELGDRVHFWPFDGWNIFAWTARHRRGLSGALVQQFRPRRPHRRSARRLLHRRLAVARRQGRQPCRISRSEPDTPRAQCGKRGRVDPRSGIATARFVILVKGLGRRAPREAPSVGDARWLPKSPPR